eukprot:TRINITY_DN1385_c0_g1_i2.p1 TRINITY_DN1385_c0_g1~~TRINITY_DN1385_c0_g1_i2.p1  ORF type:complete len:425 (+),score=102.53 TRINITY_DN1385_c0_g1_i2:26-1276(+)
MFWHAASLSPVPPGLWRAPVTPTPSVHAPAGLWAPEAFLRRVGDEQDQVKWLQQPSAAVAVAAEGGRVVPVSSSYVSAGRLAGGSASWHAGSWQSSSAVRRGPVVAVAPSAPAPKAAAAAAKPSGAEREATGTLGTVACLHGGSGFHKVAYREFAAQSGTGSVVVCVHGLTRNSTDFFPLARQLSSGAHRVLCVDVVGRGESEWLAAKELYGYPQYIADLSAVVARTGGDGVKWVGTSMGGLIGMFLASFDNSPVTKLVINDIGPFVSAKPIARLLEYVGKNVEWSSFDEAMANYQAMFAGFGELSDAEWRKLVENSVEKGADGKYRARYDPGISVPLNAGGVPKDIDLWAVWDKVKCPVLLFHGAESDILTDETVAEMKRRGPKSLTVVEVPRCGHAPLLWSGDQIAAIAKFLAD